MFVFIISIYVQQNVIIGFIFPLMRVNGATAGQTTAALNSRGGGREGGDTL